VGGKMSRDSLRFDGAGFFDASLIVGCGQKVARPLFVIKSPFESDFEPLNIGYRQGNLVEKLNAVNGHRMESQ
jgi:hypothetical protein